MRAWRRFLAGQAFGAGFRVISRNPLAVPVWCATYLVVAVGPLTLMAAMIWPQVQALVALNAAEVSPDSPAATRQMMTLISQANALQPIQWVTSLASATLLAGAVFRAVLAPDDKAFFYLRLSRQELWLALGLVVGGVAMFILMFICMIPMAIVIVVLAVAEGDAPSIGGLLAIAVLVLIILGAMLWLFLRFSLGLPMSFADSQFRLFDSWGLTRGQAGKMALVGVAVTAVYAVLQAVLIGGFLVAAFAAFAFTVPTADMDFSTLTFGRVAPVIGLAVLLLTGLNVAATILYWAPLADIYAQLTAQREAADAAPAPQV